MAQAVRTRIATEDRSQAVYDAYPLEQRISESVRWNRSLAWLLGTFAGLAVLLAAIGVYSVVSHAVYRRTQELGVRIAMGTEPGALRLLIIRKGMGPVVAGVVVGIAGAFATTRLLSSLLHGVKACDALTFAGVALLLMGIGLVACTIPAHGATRLDPTEALRHE